ncbi:MAG: helix-turn-helix transcriptional regulator [Parvularculaceae bacterium]
MDRRRQSAEQKNKGLKNRLKVLRAERNLTQADLARLVDVTRQTILAIESGRFDPSLALAYRLSDVFGSPVEAIFLKPEPGSGLS